MISFSFWARNGLSGGANRTRSATESKTCVAAAVRAAQALDDLLGDGEHAGRRQGAGGEQGLEGLAVHELHHHEGQALRRLAAVDC